ncbi:MAG: nitrile hydratase subunit beta [Thiotrichales bacterium]|nr:nitrile hydratase subunit beta [Thiotrichales bacterium]|tara:strand:+ start:1201 stop:1854 length:654 start_codon:yes stop_codon:yes gene_type:complete
MDGVHDMGGMHGFGKVPFEADEPAFHHDWERRVWGLVGASTYPDTENLDAGRHAIERLPPHLYLSYSYFERWLYSLTTTLLDGDLVTLDEVLSGKAASDSTPRSDALDADAIHPYERETYQRDVEVLPGFQIGDVVHTGNPHPAGHTRLPRYARDKPGWIHLHHGAHVLPDSNAHGDGEAPTHLYTVAFRAQDLWGPEASPKDKVYLDIWECHLERA